jgi:predicted SAM-dependent methyltransferase
MGRQVEIGPGTHPLGAAWECVDTIPRPHVQHIAHWGTDRLPFEDQTVSLIYASHVLEHVAWTHTVEALKEAHRILEPGGVLELWVPNMQKIVMAWVNGEVHKDGWWRANPDHDPDIWLNGRIFTHGPGDENFHRAGFTPALLRKRLQAAGFVDVRPLSKPRGYDHGFINLGMRGSRR